MGYERVPFPEIEWRPGDVTPLERKKTSAGGVARMLEFAPGFVDPQWCQNGHAALILEGTLVLEFAEETIQVGPGEAFVIDAGTRHRASNPGTIPTLLFIAAR